MMSSSLGKKKHWISSPNPFSIYDYSHRRSRNPSSDSNPLFIPLNPLLVLDTLSSLHATIPHHPMSSRNGTDHGIELKNIPIRINPFFPLKDFLQFPCSYRYPIIKQIPWGNPVTHTSTVDLILSNMQRCIWTDLIRWSFAIVHSIILPA